MVFCLSTSVSSISTYNIIKSIEHNQTISYEQISPFYEIFKRIILLHLLFIST